MTPTAIGEAVIRRCFLLAGDLRRLDEEVRQLSDGVGGRVDVIVSPLAAMRIIPEVYARFSLRFPQVQLCITGGHAPRAFRPLLQGDADFVIGPAPQKGQTAGLRAQALLSTPIAILTGLASRFAKTTQLIELQAEKMGPSWPSRARASFFRVFSPAGAPATQSCHYFGLYTKCAGDYRRQ